MTLKADVGIIICFIGYEPLTESTIQYIKDEVLPVLDKMGLGKISIEEVHENTQYVEKTRTITYNGKVPKGKAIRDCLSYLYEKSPEIIIYMDGSQKIDKKYIINICEIFRDRQDCDIVLSKRGTEKGIAIERYQVEEFENYIVENHYKCHLPDGQCGCWAFKNHQHVSHKINFTAEGYEIELNLMIEVLEKKLNFVFMPLEIVTEKGKSPLTAGFPKELYVEIHTQKIKFIAKSLQKKKFEIVAILDEFCSTGKCLPGWYTEDVIKKITFDEPNFTESFVYR
jgi:hypothetical protein